MTLTMRNCGLVLPKNYVSIEKDEVEYIDGGVYIKNSDILYMIGAFGFTFRGLGGLATLKAALTPVIPLMFSWINTIPVAGWILFGVICASTVYTAGVFAYAAISGKGVEIGTKGLYAC